MSLHRVQAIKIDIKLKLLPLCLPLISLLDFLCSPANKMISCKQILTTVIRFIYAILESTSDLAKFECGRLRGKITKDKV